MLVSHLASEKEVVDKIDRCLRNFELIWQESKHLNELPVLRGMDLVDRLCRAEYEDIVSKNTKLKTDNVLGKRKEKHIFDLEREIDPRKLIFPDKNCKIILMNDEDLQSKIVGVLECICDNLEKLRLLKEIHSLKSSHLQQSGIKREGLYLHEKNLVQVALESKLSAEDKFQFLWDVVSEEFDKDDQESLYTEYIKFIIDSLNEMEELKQRAVKPWENFMKRLPCVTEEILEHIFNVTENDKNSTLLFEIVQFSHKELKIKAAMLILKLGHTKVLKLIDKLLSPEAVLKIVVPQAIEIYTKLTEQSDQLEQETEDKIKRMINPILMCLQKNHSIFKDIIAHFGCLPKLGKKVIEDKFESILKTVLKSNEAAKSVLATLYQSIRTADSQNVEVELTNLFESFKVYMSEQGQTWSEHLSELLRDLIIEQRDVALLKDCAKELSTAHLITILLVFNQEKLLTSELISQLAKKSGKNLPEQTLEVIFYDVKQLPLEHRLNAYDLVYSLKSELVKLQTTAAFCQPDFIQLILKKLNGLSSAAGKPSKPVPLLFMPFLLEIIFKMNQELKRAKPCDEFLDVITSLIKTGKHREKEVWPGLVRFASFDKDLMQNKIANLLPGEDWQDLSNEIV